MSSQNLHVCIIGAGIGGLVCAIACRQQGLSVEIFEQAPEILPIGAGIQVPPNATRALDRLGLMPAMKTAGNEVKAIIMRRYQDGAVLNRRELKHDSPWILIHRADYLDVLMNRLKELGVPIHLDSKVENVDFEAGKLYLANGKVATGDVIIGADGLWSATRSKMLGHVSEPYETGDLAYRATFTRKQLEDLNDPRVVSLCSSMESNVWFGPEKHSVLYPVKNGTQFNMVLVRPDNLAKGKRTEKGDIDEMRDTFVGWDDVLTKIISCISSCLKWKLMHHDELESWTKGTVALLGDACHPTLPYQAQGAAMAAEDGTVLGLLLGKLNSSLRNNIIRRDKQRSSIIEILGLYEQCQKRRTTTNVLGAIGNQHFYHMPDGPAQQARDEELKRHTYTNEKSRHTWCDMNYVTELLDYDVWAGAENIYEKWEKGYTQNGEISSVL
ncbi:hypothetical protein PV08_03682 [Exophiala spinifera]|uniref:FAD-binding domain-containing protein n=1 Tax=Exophiala spinifera TaxID=91928 RepID=A0A0D2A3B4_9EURO|nr:uncharacterized protein PV08_03682 [Exophiala spinifera]KIW19387.1 hypothetical protein PV08_03682 [Exophiala spinifera]